jgi:integrase
MAWLERDRPNGPFQLVFRLGDERFKRSTRTTDQREADELVVRVERKLRLLEQGDLTLPDDVDVATFLMANGHHVPRSRPAKSITLEQLSRRYCESLPDGALEENSRTTLDTHIRHFLRLTDRNCRARDLTAEILQRFVNQRSQEKGRRDKRVSPTTIKKELTSMNGIWNFGLARGYVNRPFPNQGLRFPKTAEKPRFQTYAEIEHQIEIGQLSLSEQEEMWDALFLTLPEVDEFLDFIRDQTRQAFLYPMISAAAHTGARRSELIRAQRRDFDFQARTVTLREKKRTRGRLTTRLVPLSARLRQTMADWFAESAVGKYAFFVDDRPNVSCIENRQPSQLTANQARDHFKRMLDGKWSHVRGWHVLRHSFASNCVAKGVDQRIINSWMGHQTEEMVRRYQHLVPDLQQRAIESVFQR